MDGDTLTVDRLVANFLSSEWADLQPLGYQVLVAIASGKATSATAIVDRLQTDKSAVSRHVRQLEDLGLVESRPVR